MKNIDVIKMFVNGRTTGKVGNVQIDGDKFFNYGICIAQRSPEGFILNVTKYSRTTSAIQTMLRREMPHARTVDNIPRATYDLVHYLPATAN